MVEDSITDGKRIAELLASELTGLETGPLATVEVVDAEPDVSPAPEGAFAYRIAHGGEPIGSVSVFPEYVLIHLDVDPGNAPGDTPRDVLSNVDSSGTNGVTVRVDSGRAVKTGVDAVQQLLVARDG